MKILEWLRRVYAGENPSIEPSQGDDASGKTEWATYSTPKEHDWIREIDKRERKPVKKEREQFDEEAWNFYTGQLLLELRKESKMTQEELAQRINSSKSYVSRIERGQIIPSVSVFCRIINALGLCVDIVRPLA